MTRNYARGIASAGMPEGVFRRRRCANRSSRFATVKIARIEARTALRCEFIWSLLVMQRRVRRAAVVIVGFMTDAVLRLASLQDFLQLRAVHAELLRCLVDGQALADDEADRRPVQGCFRSAVATTHVEHPAGSLRPQRRKMYSQMYVGRCMTAEQAPAPVTDDIRADESPASPTGQIAGVVLERCR